MTLKRAAVWVATFIVAALIIGLAVDFYHNQLDYALAILDGATLR